MELNFSDLDNTILSSMYAKGFGNALYVISGRAQMYKGGMIGMERAMEIIQNKYPFCAEVYSEQNMAGARELASERRNTLALKILNLAYSHIKQLGEAINEQDIPAIDKESTLIGYLGETFRPNMLYVGLCKYFGSVMGRAPAKEVGSVIEEFVLGEKRNETPLEIMMSDVPMEQKN